MRAAAMMSSAVTSATVGLLKTRRTEDKSVRRVPGGDLLRGAATAETDVNGRGAVAGVAGRDRLAAQETDGSCLSLDLFELHDTPPGRRARERLTSARNFGRIWSRGVTSNQLRNQRQPAGSPR